MTVSFPRRFENRPGRRSSGMNQMRATNRRRSRSATLDVQRLEPRRPLAVDITGLSVNPISAPAVDVAAPAIRSIAAPAAGTYAAGKTLAFRVRFTEPVTVTGQPTLPITIGDSVRQAVWSGRGSGTRSLVFTHTVQPGDSAPTGVRVAGPIETSPSATIRDAAGNGLVPVQSLDLNALQNHRSIHHQIDVGRHLTQKQSVMEQAAHEQAVGGRSTHGPAAVTRGGAPISLDTRLGALLLDRSTAKRGFALLVSHFTTQVNETFCSVATSAMILNASGIPRPVSTQDPYYHYFDQTNILNDQVRQTIDVEDLKVRGLTLDRYGRLIGCFPVASRVNHADQTSLAGFRRTAIRALRSAQSYVVVNYQRAEIGQETGGHFSPLAAYDAKSDRFLILDVSRYAYPPVWVPANRLFNAMRAVDSDSGMSRGFVLIKASPTHG